MSKVTTMLATMSGIMIGFYFLGILPPTSSTGALMSLLLNPTGILSSNLYTVILGIITAAGLVGTIYYSRFTPSDFYMVVPMVTVFIGFLVDFYQVFNALGSSGGAFQIAAVFLFGPFMLLYVLGVVEWWRGAL